MRKKHFYSHIVEINTITVEMNAMDLDDKQREYLLSLADSNIHHSVVDTILSELSHEDKKIFLRLSVLDDHHAIWRFLNSKVKGIEEKIKQAALEIKEKLHLDIKEAKEKSS